MKVDFRQTNPAPCTSGSSVRFSKPVGDPDWKVFKHLCNGCSCRRWCEDAPNSCCVTLLSFPGSCHVKGTWKRTTETLHDHCVFPAEPPSRSGVAGCRPRKSCDLRSHPTWRRKCLKRMLARKGRQQADRGNHSGAIVKDGEGENLRTRLL